MVTDTNTSEGTMLQTLCMVTTCTASAAISPTLSVVMQSSEPPTSTYTTATFPVVTPAIFLQATTSTTTDALAVVTKATRWSQIQNRPVEGTVDDSVSEGLEQSNKTTTVHGEDEYFEVLTYNQDDIIHLSKSEIMKHQPSVKLARLHPDEISKAVCQPASDSDNTTSSSMEKSPLTKKRPCFRPRRKPSQARIKAQ